MPEIAVLARREPAIHLFVLDRSGLLQEKGRLGLSRVCHRLVCGDLDGDRVAELVALSTDDLTVVVLRRGRGGVAQTAIALDAPRGRMVLADITNDGKRDVLLFGKAATGIATVVSPRRGAFALGPTLVPDLSVADARAADLNADGVADLAMLDWVARRVEVLFGVADTVFSDEVSISLEGEPSSLDVARPSMGRSVLMAIAVPEREVVRIVEVDPTGALMPHEALNFRGSPRSVVLKDVTGDGIEDLLLAGEDSFAVLAGLKQARFSSPAEFSVQAEEGLWEVADIDGDRARDLAVADRRTRRLIVLGNARRPATGPWPDTYAVGREPRSIAAIDCNEDGWEDLVVSNTASGTLSVLVNEGGGRFGGQQSFQLPGPPSQLVTLRSLVRRENVLLSTHKSAEQISALVIADGDLSRPDLIVMRTGPEPRIQYAAVEGTPPLLHLLVRSTVEGGPGSVALSLFEQLRDDQFLERQFLARFPRQITALAVGAFEGGRTPDAILATYDHARQRTALSIAPSRGAFEFRTVEPLTIFGDTLRGIRDLFTADVDGDGNPDLLVIPEAPRIRMGLLRGLGHQGALSQELTWIRDVYPSRDIPPYVGDVSGDGIPDLVLLDELRGSVVALYGEGSGRFRSPVVIASGSGVHGLAVGDFRHHKTSDLAITFGDRGVVSLLFSPFAQ